MKKQLFVLGGGLLLTLLIVSGVISYLGNKTLVLDDVSLKEVISDNSFAIYVDDGTAGDETDDKNYVEYDGDAFPLKADGYKYNEDKSTCIDNNGNVTTDVTLYYNNDMIQISTSETVYCYIYFDLYTTKGDWCLANEITDNLGECAIVMDDYSYTVELAKETIEEKGEADTSKIAPTITYGKSISYAQSVDLSTTGYFLVGQDFSFSDTTGMYTLKTTSDSSTLTDDYIGYYVCSDGYSTSCGTMYKIISYTVTGTTTVTQTITTADVYTYSTNDSIDSEVGLYMTYDDDGTTYYYRGNVKNNYVYFAGFYWRIIRINGDGSVRMIYAGTDVNDTSDDQIGTSSFNETNSDPTYVGYKYGNISETPIIMSSSLVKNVMDSRIYYFSTGYEETSSNRFKLSSDGLISGTFSELFGSGGTYENSITDYYTCFSTLSTDTCKVLGNLASYNSSTSVNAYYIAYTSESYADMLANSHNSTIKETVDKWYEENIKDKYDDEQNHLLSEYISTSAIFCGDRSVYSGSAYLLTGGTYSAVNRIATYKPSLYCNDNEEDAYSVDNGNLDYPIALISVDEVAFAGGRISNVNTLYYLYTGSAYWTMSPSYFLSNYIAADAYQVTAVGSIDGSRSVSTTLGVRPVINVSSNVKISSGTGTSSNPFVVTLD